MFRDQDGVRHAVRLGAVLAASDVDCDQGSTVVQLAGNRQVVAATALDEFVSWFS